MGALEGNATTVYHLATAADWSLALARGAYRHTSLDREGFVHCSTPDQLAETAALHFERGQDLMLLAVDPARLDAELRWEASRHGVEFPHVYGPINLDAITEARPWRWD